MLHKDPYMYLYANCRLPNQLVDDDCGSDISTIRLTGIIAVVLVGRGGAQVEESLDV
jgi:hypothetical protein